MKINDIEEILANKAQTPALLRALTLDKRRGVRALLTSQGKALIEGQEERCRLSQIYDLEKEALTYGLAAGVDEAGRGPLAGPVYAAAVVLPIGEILVGLKDSKKLKRGQRQNLRDKIKTKALSYSVAYASVEEIEALNISQATFLAMGRAVRGLSVACQVLLVDGNQDPGLTGFFTRTVVDGDNRSASIAAASILAKEARDQVMDQIHQLYPHYGFDKHMGYGTRDHYQALADHGPSPLHRLSFLSKGNPYG